MYIAPERLESAAFLERMRGIRIGLFAVDEAHCISEWGHDFRPSYMKLKEAVEFLGKPQVVALTATATPDVREDIRRQLALRDSKLIVRGFHRPNLTFKAIIGGNKNDVLFQACSEQECGIVYAGTRKNVEEITQFLKRHSISAEAYHAGLPDEERKRVQEKFMYGDTRVIVATSAFGMGIDKRDVRFVIHHDMPGTIEQYYQEAGRAGRDGKESTCTLLFHPSDLSLPEFFIKQAYPDKGLVQNVYTQLHHAAGTQLGQTFPGLVHLNAQTLASMIGRTNESAVRGALDLLERSGYVRRINASYAQSTVQFLYSAERFRQWLIDAAPPTLEPVAVALLRTVGGEAFHVPVQVVLSDIEEKTFLQEEVILQGLRELHRLGIIEFHSGQKASGIALLGQRVQVRDLAIDYHSQQKRMKHQMEKLKAMRQYIEGKACRRNLILEYFEEADIEGTCGKCDNCTSTRIVLVEDDDQKVFDTYNKIILHCIAELGGRFGRTTIVDVLHGAKTKRVAQFRLYEASTYAKASKVDKPLLLDAIDSMIGLGWVAKTESVHPAIVLTAIGEEKLGVRVTAMSLPRPAENGEQSLNDPVLYEALRGTRRRLASERNVPSHNLVADSVLRAIANTLPQTEDDLLAIEGMGPVTIKRCGKQFLHTVQEYLKEKNLATAIGRSKAVIPTLSHSLQTTYALCVQGMNLMQIVEHQQLTEGTVSQHISELIERGVHLRVDQFVPEIHQRQIRRVVPKLGKPNLKHIKAMIDDDISYAEIRVMLALLAREKWEKKNI